MPRRSEDDPRFLIRTPAGVIFKGDRVRWVKRAAAGGWMTARSVDVGGRWVNGTDDRGRARSIRVDLITRVVAPKEGILR